MTQDYSLGPNLVSESSGIAHEAVMHWMNSSSDVRRHVGTEVVTALREAGYTVSPEDTTTNTCHDGQCFTLLRHCLSLCEPGFGLEFGVQTGHSLGLIARRLAGVGFDSFKGLPEGWGPFTKGEFAHERPYVGKAQLVVGWFSDTLPKFDFATVDPLRLVHIDCDLYSSTKMVLDHLGPHLTPGVIVVFDEFLYDWPPHESRGGEEQRAWREFADHTQINWEVIGHSEGAWAIQIV